MAPRTEIPWPELPPPFAWGLMTPERHAALARRGIYLRVYVGAEDVTLRCRRFDDTPGRMRAELLRVNEAGHYYVGADGVVAMDIVTAFRVWEGAPWPTTSN